MRRFVIAVTLACASLSWGQTGLDGGGIGTVQPIVTANISTTRCTRLDHDEFIANAFPGKSGMIRQVSEPIACSADFTFRPGFTFVACYWTGLDFYGSDQGEDVLGYAHEPNEFTATCRVVYVSPSGEWGAKFTSKKLWCIGGPIEYGVFKGVAGAPTRRVGDGDLPGPVNGQWFTKDTALPAPAGWQQAQCITAHPYGGQPSGVTYSWTTPASFKRLDSGGANAQMISLGATGPSHRVMPVLTYHFDNHDPSDPVAYDGLDDSLKLIWPDYLRDSNGNPYNNAGKLCPDLGKIGAYKPTKIIQVGVDAPETPGCTTTYLYQLQDQTFAAMKGVYIAERWPLDFDQEAAQVWMPVESDGFYDSFWWPLQSTRHRHVDGYPAMIAQAVHRYFAATTDACAFDPANASEKSGLLVLTTTTTWWDDFAENK